MKFQTLLCFALALAPLPAFAQQAPAAEPPAFSTPSPAMAAAMQQSRAQLEQLRLQARTRMLASLTPAHRTMLANVVGQLALSANPNPRAAAATLDAMLAPAEKQSIINIDAAVRTSSRSIMQAQRAAFEANLSAEQRTQMAARQAKMEAYRQSHPRPAYTPDAGMIALRTLGSFGGPAMGWGRGGHGPGA